MSQKQISLSPDLKRLRDDGYNIEIRAAYLLLKDVPYVTPAKEVKRGVLVSKLTLAGDVTARPDDHQVQFAGEHPCHRDGSPMTELVNQALDTKLDDGLTVKFSFSQKPPPGYYEDYYEKMTTYAAILTGHADALQPDATARVYRVEVLRRACAGSNQAARSASENSSKRPDLGGHSMRNVLLLNDARSTSPSTAQTARRFPLGCRWTPRSMNVPCGMQPVSSWNSRFAATRGCSPSSYRPFRNGPGAVVSVFPKRAAWMNQENLHGIGQTVKQQDTGALFGHRLSHRSRGYSKSLAGSRGQKWQATWDHLWITAPICCTGDSPGQYE